MKKPSWLKLSFRVPSWLQDLSERLTEMLSKIFPSSAGNDNSHQLLTIHRLVEKNDLKGLKILLAKENVSFDLTDEKGDTPLFIAARKGFVEIVKFLIVQKASIEHINILGKTALFYAVENGHLEIIDALVQAGASYLHTDSHLQNIVHAALLSDQHQSLVFILEYPEIPLNSGDRFGQTPLILATDRNMVAAAKALLAKGAMMNVMDHDGWTPLMYAAKSGSIDLLSIYLANNADLESHDLNFRQTPYLIACRQGHVEIMRILLKQGAKADHRDYYERTALHIAVEVNKLEVVNFVLSTGIDLAAKDRFHLTALEWAIVNASAEIVKAIRDALKQAQG